MTPASSGMDQIPRTYPNGVKEHHSYGRWQLLLEAC